MNVLVLQGGGALGAYQGGAFEALAASGHQPQWIAGISIGAINAALMAGNAPEDRVDRLRAFWDVVSSSIPPSMLTLTTGPLRAWSNDCAAAWGAAFGLPGFFRPHGLTPLSGCGPSLYDTQPLRRTLLELVDFDRLNDGPMRLSVGAVDVESGNFEYFDNRSRRIGPEHIMASGALPPGFPAVKVEGRLYWDGGLVSNTPLRHVVENLNTTAATIFQVDLFSARGEVPATLGQVAEREKDIRFSSRTRAVTDLLRDQHEAHRRLRAMAGMLTPDQRRSARVQAWLAQTRDGSIDLVHLIRRYQSAESQSKDYEFSRASMLERWQHGRDDMSHSLRELAAAGPPTEPGEFRVFDFTRPVHDTSATAQQRVSS
jgi:NTE family protein